MTDEAKNCLVGCILSFVLGMLVTMVIFAITETYAPLNSRFVRSALVKAGHAEYYLDTDNVRQWRLKPMGEVHPWPQPGMLPKEHQ